MRSESRAAAFFLAPALILIALFFLVPVVAALALSLTDFDLYALGDIHNIRFVALANYAGLLRSADFWKALLNTLYFALFGGPLTVLVSLAAALLVNAKLARFKSVFRII